MKVKDDHTKEKVAPYLVEVNKMVVERKVKDENKEKDLKTPPDMESWQVKNEGVQEEKDKEP